MAQDGNHTTGQTITMAAVRQTDNRGSARVCALSLSLSFSFLFLFFLLGEKGIGQEGEEAKIMG